VIDIDQRSPSVKSDRIGIREVLRGLKLQKMLFRISTLHQSVDSERCNVDCYCLQEARCLIEHSFEIIEASTPTDLSVARP